MGIPTWVPKLGIVRNLLLAMLEWLKGPISKIEYNKRPGPPEV